MTDAATRPLFVELETNMLKLYFLLNPTILWFYLHTQFTVCRLYITAIEYFQIYHHLLNYFCGCVPVEASGLSGQQAVGVRSGFQISEDTPYRGGATKNVLLKRHLLPGS